MPYGFRVAFVKIRRGSNMAIFTGAGVAIVTPFKEDESIDYDRLDELIDFHCENGTDSIVICGTSGEAATMTEREHMECVKFTVERTKRKNSGYRRNRLKLYEDGNGIIKRSRRIWRRRRACRDTIL